MRDTRSKLDLKAQAAWALGNVAGESPGHRENLMAKGFTTFICDVLREIYEDTYDEALDSARHGGKMQFHDEDYYSNVEALLWALSNMSRGGFRVADYCERVKW